MKVMKLELSGHVTDCPARPISSYYSWPLGTTMEEVGRLVDGFSKAFCNVVADVWIIPTKPVDFITLNLDVVNI